MTQANSINHAAVHLAFGERRQLSVLFLLLIQAQLKKVDDLQVAQDCLINRLPMAKLVRPGYQRAVAVNLVVLDGLSRSDNRRVLDVLVLDLANEFFTFLDEAENGLAGHALWGLA